MNALIFDIETIPDFEFGRRLHDEWANLDDRSVVEAMLLKRREETDGSDFLPLHFHRVVAISVVLKTPQGLNVWSLGDETSSESEIIERFFAGLEKYSPVLISWNGSGFDLPVLHYRSLLHGIACQRYWETGETDSAFRWNNYLNRYHYRHMDVMDILAGYQMRANAKLDEISVMLGFPGKMGMSGAKVWDSFLSGNIKGIRDYCETDVLNTYLVYQRFQLIRGELTQEEYDRSCQEVRDFLKQSNQPHLLSFLSEWQRY